MSSVQTLPASRGLVHGTRRRMLAVVTTGFFAGFAGVSIFGPLVPKFRDLLGLSVAEAALLAAIPNLTGSLLRIPFGAAVDRFGGKRPFLVLLAAANLGVIGLLVTIATRYPDHLAGWYPLLLVLGALVGCGIATFSVGVGLLSYWFPKSMQGSAQGAYAGLGNTGPGISALLLPVAVAGIGMTAGYSIWFVILFAATIAFALLAYDGPWFQYRRAGRSLSGPEAAALGGSDLVPSGSATEALRRSARNGRTWVLVWYYFLSFGGFLALTAWLPSYWNGMYHVSLREAGILTAAFSLVSAFIRVPGGLLSDRITIRWASEGNFALMLAGLVVLAFSTQMWVSFTATIAIAVGMGLQNAIVFKLLPIYVPDGVGGAAGWVGGLGALGGFAVPPMIGLVTGAVTGPHSYGFGFLPFAGLVLLAFPVALWARRHFGAPTPR